MSTIHVEVERHQAGSGLTSLFGDLFRVLGHLGYEWEPQSPERLVKLRRTPEVFSALVRYFGLGLPVNREELLEEGLSLELYTQVETLHLAVGQGVGRISGSRMGSCFVCHDHWPPKPGDAGNYVYFGQETLSLIRQFREEGVSFSGKRVLDLGSGSGALGLEIAAEARRVLGMDTSPRAVAWSTAIARAQGMMNVDFVRAAVGTPLAEAAASLKRDDKEWDLALFNPPMTIPYRNQCFPHRDGGPLGIELPLVFLKFAQRHLRSQGEVLCLITNPLVRGRPAFFDRLDTRVWEILERRCLDDHFNQSLYRKERYDEYGIQHIELVYLHLRKR